MITKFKIFENNNLDDTIIKCVNDNTYRALDIIPDKKHTMKVILNNFSYSLYVINFKELIKYNFPLNAKDNDGDTALILASNQGNIEIVKLLIGAGVDLNIKNNGGGTALMWASKYNHIEIAKLLINAGANLNIKNKYDDTALIIANNNKHKKIVELLKSKGAK